MSRLRMSSRENCINWRGSVLRSGDNVIFMSKTESRSLPGQIIDIQDYRDVPNKERPFVLNVRKHGRTRMILMRHRRILKGKEIPPIDPFLYCHIPEGIEEVVDTLELEWVQWNFVISPCFIFHADTLQRGLFTCSGMERLYYIRFSSSRNGKMIPIRENKWCPFYRDELFPDAESYPEVLWNNIVSMKHEVNKVLCRGGQWDGRTVTAKLQCPPSFFRYVKDELEEVFGDQIRKKTIRCQRQRKVMFDTLAVTRRKVTHRGELIRILNEDQLDVVRKIFGLSFGVGVLQPLPSLKFLRANPSVSATVWLRNSDPVRIVSCIAEREHIDDGLAKPVCDNAQSSREGSKTMKIMCSYRGMDIRYTAVKYGFSEVSIQLRFVKVRGDSNVVKKLFEKGEYDGSDGDSSSIMVSEGDFITLESNRVYRVSAIGEDGMVRCVSPANPINEPIVISIDEANEALSRQCSR